MNIYINRIKTLKLKYAAAVKRGAHKIVLASIKRQWGDAIKALNVFITEMEIARDIAARNSNVVVLGV